MGAISRAARLGVVILGVVLGLPSFATAEVFTLNNGTILEGTPGEVSSVAVDPTRGLGETGLRPPPRLHLHSQLHLLLTGQQRIAADLVEVEAHRVGHRDLADLDELLGDTGAFLGEPYPLGPECVGHFLEGLSGGLGVLQLLLDLGHGEKAPMPAPFDQGCDDLAQFLVHNLEEDRFSCCKAIKRRRLSE